PVSARHSSSVTGLEWVAPSRVGSGLEVVEEHSGFAESPLVLGRDLDARRRQEEHALAHLLDTAREGIGEAGGEVEEPPGAVAIGRAQVEDHRSAGLEAVGDLPRLVE